MRAATPGYASVRPLIGTLLPRQGVPPAIASWAAFARDAALDRDDPSDLVVGAAAARGHGTLEVRVCDTQTTLQEAAAIAAYVHALVAWLVERDDERGVRESWRIEREPLFAAARHGLDASFADLATGERRPVRDILRERLERSQPVAERLGCAAELAGRLLERQRRGPPARGGRSMPPLGWLADRFLS